MSELTTVPQWERFREEDTAKDDWDEEFGGDFYEALSRKTSTNSISACSPDVRKLLDRQRRLSLKDNDTLEPILVSLGDVSAAELEQLLLPHGDSKMVFDPVLSRWVGEEVDMSGFEWEEDGEVCEEGEKTVDMEQQEGGRGGKLGAAGNPSSTYGFTRCKQRASLKSDVWDDVLEGEINFSGLMSSKAHNRRHGRQSSTAEKIVGDKLGQSRRLRANSGDLAAFDSGGPLNITREEFMRAVSQREEVPEEEERERVRQEPWFNREKMRWEVFDEPDVSGFSSSSSDDGGSESAQAECKDDPDHQPNERSLLKYREGSIDWGSGIDLNVLEGGDPESSVNGGRTLVTINSRGKLVPRAVGGGDRDKAEDGESFGTMSTDETVEDWAADFDGDMVLSLGAGGETAEAARRGSVKVMRPGVRQMSTGKWRRSRLSMTASTSSGCPNASSRDYQTIRKSQYYPLQVANARFSPGTNSWETIDGYVVDLSNFDDKDKDKDKERGKEEEEWGRERERSKHHAHSPSPMRQSQSQHLHHTDGLATPSARRPSCSTPSGNRAGGKTSKGAAAAASTSSSAEKREKEFLLGASLIRYFLRCEERHDEFLAGFLSKQEYQRVKRQGILQLQSTTHLATGSERSTNGAGHEYPRSRMPVRHKPSVCGSSGAGATRSQKGTSQSLSRARGSPTKAASSARQGYRRSSEGSKKSGDATAGTRNSVGRVSKSRGQSQGASVQQARNCYRRVSGKRAVSEGSKLERQPAKQKAAPSLEERRAYALKRSKELVLMKLQDIKQSA